MSEKADKFRRFAEEARKYMEKSINEAEKERWLKIAERWEQLATKRCVVTLGELSRSLSPHDHQR